MIDRWTDVAGLLGALCWAIGGMIYSRLPVRASAINVGKNTVASVMLLAVVLLAGDRFTRPAALDAGSLLLLAGSGIVGILIGDSSYLRSLQLLGPRRALILSTLGPPISAILGWFLFAEVLTVGQLVAMALTLGGVALVIRERTATVPGVIIESSGRGMLHGVNASLCQAVGAAMTRHGMRDLDPVDPITPLIRLATAALIGWTLAVSTGRARRWWGELTAPGIPQRILIGTTFGTFLGIWLSLIAIGVLPLATASTQTSTTPIFMTVLVALVWREKVSLRAWIGTAIAVGGVGLLIHSAA